METFYYNLSGGINQSTTKTELGLNTKNIYWSDAENVEIFLNKGIIRQKGNVLYVQIPDEEKITGLHEFGSTSDKRLLITTASGKIYIYNPQNSSTKLLEQNLKSTSLCFTKFLNGLLVSSLLDKMVFVKTNGEITDCTIKDGNGKNVYSDITSVYKGRIWVASGSTLYFSALGSYTDFSTENDAGYIKDFYTDTDDIIAIKPYKDYLAIYKKHRTYLLSGSTPDDFALTPFADKGAETHNGIINVDNKEFFFSNSGIYTLEVGDLNQILLGSNITQKIKTEFQKFNKTRFKDVFTLNYEAKNQVWYFIPYNSSLYFHTIWINDIENKAWYKRVLPQNITCACILGDEILTADDKGKIYRENIGNSFDGSPIEFLWKSPFLSIGSPTIRKTIDEFYFILDESYENNFKFSVYKNYDSENKDDNDLIYSSNFENLVWSKEDSVYPLNDTWDNEDSEAIWALDSESAYKAEISEANYAIQLCVEGNQLEHHAAIIGIEFKEIFNED